MRVLLVATACALVLGARGEGQSPRDVASLVRQLTRESSWRLVQAVHLRFTTFHPQGLVKVGDEFILSSVEVTTPTRRFPAPDGRYDRDVGAGVGHLFKFDADGRLITDLRIGEGAVYHPGGIDYDGHDVWVPLTEYRPNSRSIVYRVDPQTMHATNVVGIDDSIGAVVHDVDGGLLHGASWGSRWFYSWPLTADRIVPDGVQPSRVANPSHYVDYQDCKSLPARQMLCTGVADVSSSPTAMFRLGGIDLVSLIDFRPMHQVPVGLRTSRGTALMQNPSWFEGTATGLRGYFVPDDDTSALYVYEIQ